MGRLQARLRSGSTEQLQTPVIVVNCSQTDAYGHCKSIDMPGWSCGRFAILARLAEVRRGAKALGSSSRSARTCASHPALHLVRRFATQSIGVPGWSCGRFAILARLAEVPAGIISEPSSRSARTSGSHPALHTVRCFAAQEIGVPGFEPGTSATRTQRSTGLSHTPDYSGIQQDGVGWSCGRFAIAILARLAEVPDGCSASPYGPLDPNPRSIPLRGLGGLERNGTPDGSAQDPGQIT